MIGASLSSFTPSTADNERLFIGTAAMVCELMDSKADALKRRRNGTLKVLFYGAPGVGKTELARFTARKLAGHHLAIEHVNGKEVTVETVRQWCNELALGSLFSDWTVKVVDELDRCSKDAQDLLLTYLDRLTPGRGFIGTSNLQLDLLQERFQTRLQQFKIEAPETDEIAALIVELSGSKIGRTDAARIAVGSGGNVRAALLDAESTLDLLEIQKAKAAKKGGRK